MNTNRARAHVPQALVAVGHNSNNEKHTEVHESTPNFLDIEILYFVNRASAEKEQLTLYNLRKLLRDNFHQWRSFGTLHPHLQSLERDGLIRGRVLPSEKSQGLAPKRTYKITALGKRTFSEELGSAHKIDTAMWKTQRNGTKKSEKLKSKSELR